MRTPLRQGEWAVRRRRSGTSAQIVLNRGRGGRQSLRCRFCAVAGALSLARCRWHRRGQLPSMPAHDALLWAPGNLPFKKGNGRAVQSDRRGGRVASAMRTPRAFHRVHTDSVRSCQFCIRRSGPYHRVGTCAQFAPTHTAQCNMRREMSHLLISTPRGHRIAGWRRHPQSGRHTSDHLDFNQPLKTGARDRELWSKCAL